MISNNPPSSDALMKAEEEEDIGKSNTPPTCYEPCNYSEYEYEQSHSDYPTQGYWDHYLSKQVRSYLVLYLQSYFINLFAGASNLWEGYKFCSMNSQYKDHLPTTHIAINCDTDQSTGLLTISRTTNYPNFR